MHMAIRSQVLSFAGPLPSRETRDKRGYDLRRGCAICVARQNDSTLQPRLETMPGPSSDDSTMYSKYTKYNEQNLGIPPAVDPVASRESPQRRSLDFQAHKQEIATTGRMGCACAENPSNVNSRVNAIRVREEKRQFVPSIHPPPRDDKV